MFFKVFILHVETQIRYEDVHFLNLEMKETRGKAGSKGSQ
jgi:hypothetical protein